LTFSYATATVHLDRLADEVDPQGYDLCARHATRTEAPRGWGMTDRRPQDDRVEVEPPPPATRDLGSQATVAVLAAALRAVPPAATRPAPATPVSEAATAAVPRPSPALEAVRRRNVVETLLSSPAAEEAGARQVAPRAPQPSPATRRDTRFDPTVELPRMDAPRPVPAAGDRGPATDW
jgi:hypothetical protein